MRTPEHEPRVADTPVTEQPTRDRGRRGQRGELRAPGRVGLRDAPLLGEERVGAAEAALRLPRHTGG